MNAWVRALFPRIREIAWQRDVCDCCARVVEPGDVVTVEGEEILYCPRCEGTDSEREARSLFDSVPAVDDEE